MIRALLNGRKSQTRRIIKSFRYEVGDRLWVRESFAIAPDGLPVFAADDFKRGTIEAADIYEAGIKCKPSIHMPRWASRLTLIVTDVRVQRLQEIGEEDAWAEGVWNCGEKDGGQSIEGEGCDLFRNLWQSIHGIKSWDTNPWVAAISFTVEKANIDALTNRPRCGSANRCSLRRFEGKRNESQG